MITFENNFSKQKISKKRLILSVLFPQQVNELQKKQWDK